MNLETMNQPLQSTVPAQAPPADPSQDVAQQRSKRRQDPPLAIRTTPDEQKRFRELCTELGKGQGEMLKDLISSYEINRIAAVKPGIETLVRNYQGHITAAQETVVQIAEVLTTSAERSKEESRAEIDDLRQKIVSLHSDLSDERKLRKQTEVESNSQITALNEIIAQQKDALEEMRARAEKAETAYNTQQDLLTIVKKQAEQSDAENKIAKSSADEAIAKAEDLQKEIGQLKIQLDRATKEVDNLLNENKVLKEHKQEFKTIMDLLNSTRKEEEAEKS